jgi:hypothetical protein
LLNHADDQTVLAVSAVLNAIADFGLDGEEFKDWGVVGAPRFPGRLFFANALNKFARSGPLGVSPVIVPYLSLHAISSMISLALGIHGPAVGVGGGTDGFVQALFMGLALQQEQDLPGVWVVATAWDPEPFSEGSGEGAPQPVCQALALALRPGAAGIQGGPGLRMIPRVSATAENGDAPSFPSLVRLLSTASETGLARSWSCALPGDHALELTLPNVLAGLAKSA